jgi:DNA (cytosine-5)-methyltransferase 1
VDQPAFNVLSLATGVAGLDLGIRLAVPSARLVCAVEIEAYACEVLASRMAAGDLDEAPIWTDLRTFDGRPWRGVVDLLSAGYPCQPFSVAGKMRGADDPRHLWPHVARVIRECEPPLVFLENVANHLNIGFREVRAELQGMGYRVEAGLFEACEAGAPHHRRRLYALAYSPSIAEREPQHAAGAFARKDARQDAVGGGDRLQVVADPDRDGLSVLGSRSVHNGLGPTQWRDAHGRGRSWLPCRDDVDGWRQFLDQWPSLEPAVPVGAHGMGSWMDALRLGGNGVVPQQAAHAFVYLTRQLMRTP